MWEQIQANRRRSAILITTMALVLVTLGYIAGEALLGPGSGIVGVGTALIVWGIQMGLYATSAESLLLRGAFARELTREDAPQLFNVVDEMVIASGLGFTPHIHLIDDPAPNAFAIGRKPESSAIAVTTGLLQRLNRDELQGVIAHEIGHLKNRDVQFMTLAAVMLGSIVILSEIIWRSMRLGGRSRSRSDERGGSDGQLQLILLVVTLVFAILGPLLAQLLYFACSRKREYLADASSAQFTRFPEGLAAALEKISGAPTPVSFASKATAPMFIVNPLNATGAGFSLFATHPPVADRIRILRGMTGASFADYEQAYHRLENATVIGASSLQGAVPLPIRAPAAGGPLASRAAITAGTQRAFGYLRLHCHCGLEISVPEGYDRDSIRCIRCGNTLPVPTASVEGAAPAEPQPAGAETAGTPPPLLQYTRTGDGWESFRCECGRTIQLSPAFAAPHIHCTGCGRDIQIN